MRNHETNVITFAVAVRYSVDGENNFVKVITPKLIHDGCIMIVAAAYVTAAFNTGGCRAGYFNKFKVGKRRDHEAVNLGVKAEIGT